MSEEEQNAFQMLKESIEANRGKIEEGLKEGKDKAFELFKSFLGRMNPEKAVLYAGLAYLGYENLPFHSDMVKLMWGIVGIELATTSAQGTATASVLGVSIPVNSQVAGLAMLATLGFSCLPWEDLQKKIRNEQNDTKNAYTTWQDAMKKYRAVMTDEEYEEVLRLARKVLEAINGLENLEQANASLRGYIEGMIPIWEERLLVEGDS